MENVIPLAVGRCGGGVFIWNADFPKSAWRLAETLFPSCFDALPSERPQRQNPVRTMLFQRGLLAGLRCSTGRRLVPLRPLSLAYDCVLAAMDEHKGVLRVSRTRSFSVLPCPAMFHKGGGNLPSIFSPIQHIPPPAAHDCTLCGFGPLGLGLTVTRLSFFGVARENIILLGSAFNGSEGERHGRRREPFNRLLSPGCLVRRR